MKKKIVQVSGKIVGDCMAVGITPMGLLILYSGPVIEPTLPPSMAELVADALVQRGRPTVKMPAPNSVAGKN